MQVVVNNLMTEYSRQGKGKPVLLLHGWGDSLATFKDMQDKLGKSFETVAVDLPGFGKTQAPEEAWGLNDYASFVAAFLKKTSTKPYAIVGHSNGGAIAIRGVGNGTLSTDKLVLLAASGIRGEYKGRNAALRLVAKTGKLLVKPLPHKVKKRIRSKMYTTIGSDMLVAEHLQETFKKVVTDDVRQDADHITIPTLLLYGEHDQATPVRFAQQFQKRLKNGKLQIVPEAEHFVHHDAAVQVTDSVEEFLR